jgi:hypothetical protein
MFFNDKVQLTCSGTRQKLTEAKVNFREMPVYENQFYGTYFIFPKAKDLKAAAKALGIDQSDIRFRAYFKEWCIKFF